MPRQIHDHPLYLNTLPTSEARDGVEHEGGSTKNGGVTVQPRRRARCYVPPSRRRLWSFHDGLSLPSSSATPQPGLSDRAHSFFGITRTPTRPDGSHGVQPTSHQATETAATHIPSHHSQLQSVQTIDNDDDDSDGASIIEGTLSASDILAWLPSQLYLCSIKNMSFPGKTEM
jgi:hypothetical protein